MRSCSGGRGVMSRTEAGRSNLRKSSGLMVGVSWAPLTSVTLDSRRERSFLCWHENSCDIPCLGTRGRRGEETSQSRFRQSRTRHASKNNKPRPPYSHSAAAASSVLTDALSHKLLLPVHKVQGWDRHVDNVLMDEGKYESELFTRSHTHIHTGLSDRLTK